MILGTVLWGAAVGVQESTLRAVVADLVPAPRRATAYGVFAGVLGIATLGGGTLTGVLYEHSVTALIVTVAAIQSAALILLAVTRIPPVAVATRRGHPGKWPRVQRVAP